MGLSSKKTTQNSKPVYAPQIEGAASTLGDVYAQQAPKVAGYADQLGAMVPGLIEKYQQGDAGVNAARAYNTDVLSGRYLDQGNPYMEGVISSSNNDVRNQLQAALGARGLTGGSDYAGLISDRIAKNSLATRYAAYNDERARMASAAGQAPGIAAADTLAIAPALATAQAAGSMPLDAALKYGGGVGGLLGNYTNTTSKQSGSVMDMIGMGLQVASLLSDRDAKEDIKRVGKTDGGLPVFTYRYKGDDTVHMGVMAQDVKKKQPKALGPMIGRYKSVNYGEVR